VLIPRPRRGWGISEMIHMQISRISTSTRAEARQKLKALKEFCEQSYVS
jgi:hypothetical protein